MQQSPRPEHDCEWFEIDPSSRCIDTSVNELSFTSSGVEKPVQDFCCVCGGGSRIDECYDYPDWIDSHPLERFGCSLYRENNDCFNSGSDYINLGHSANSACCVCGKNIY